MADICAREALILRVGAVSVPSSVDADATRMYPEAGSAEAPGGSHVRDLGLALHDGAAGICPRLTLSADCRAAIARRGPRLAHAHHRRCRLRPGPHFTSHRLDTRIAPRDYVVARCLASLAVVQIDPNRVSA